MRDLSYFTLGFRSDYVYNQLIGFEDGIDPQANLFDEALDIISDFLKIDEYNYSFSHFISSGDHSITVLAPLLWEVYPSIDPKEIVERLKRVLNAVSSLQGKKDIDQQLQDDFQEAITFFSNLSDTCLSKSATSVTFNSFIFQ